MERGGRVVRTRQGYASKLITRVVSVISHLQAVSGRDAQAGATVGEAEREGPAKIVGRIERLHHRNGGAAIGRRDSDYPVLVRLAIACVVGVDLYICVFTTSVGLVVDKGAVEVIAAEGL